MVNLLETARGNKFYGLLDFVTDAIDVLCVACVCLGMGRAGKRNDIVFLVNQYYAWP